MDNNLVEQYEDILLLGRELALNVLKEADRKLKNYFDLGDVDAVKSISEEVIPKYVNLYNQFFAEIPEDLDEKMLESLEKVIYDIMEKHKIDEDYLWDEVRKRISLKGNSGADVVKKLFETQLMHIEDKINEIVDKNSHLIKDLEKAEKAMANSIQRDEEEKYFELIKDIGKKIDMVNGKILEWKDKSEEIKYSINSKWKYEIYGTTPKDELLKAYNEAGVVI